MKKYRKRLKKWFPLSVRDALVTIAIIAAASAVSTALHLFSDSDSYAPLVFVPATLLVSLLTNGYFFGLLMSIVSVIGVNIVFTYPYFKLNFSLTGYPLTFFCMFAISLITSTLVSRVREAERLRVVAERERMRANLLRAISHDFRTPLTGIIGSVNAVRENGELLTAQEKDKLLRDAASEAEWLINMVENLLTITRIGASPDTVLHKEPQAVEEVLWEAASRFRKQYPNFRVDIRIPDEPLFAEMDAVLIEQVIINLLINAAIHGKTATAAQLGVDVEEEFAHFYVEDNGVGIAPEELRTLFTDYAVRQHPIKKDKIRTMGIGLSVCNTIIAAHGGQMRAENIPGGGARLSFTLPCCRSIPGIEEENYDDQIQDSGCGR